MSSPLTAADGRVVSIHYTLKLDDGAVVDSSSGGPPLAYLHGASNIVPGLEEQLAGKSPGAQLQVQVSPEKGYGDRDPQAIQQAPRSAFPDDMELEEGMQLAAEGSEGEVVPFWIQSIGDEHVTVDFNHPLAGQTLHFEVEVVEVRDATDEEREHGHPH